ncbi:hypothetical protein MASR2M66_15840 [Chloroflexota bacterium]
MSDLVVIFTPMHGMVFAKLLDRLLVLSRGLNAKGANEANLREKNKDFAVFAFLALFALSIS